ncbi:MAG: tetratricopeptide repeat protein, partial [Myxococcota bacterium]
PRYLLTVRNRGFRLVVDGARSTWSIATLVQVAAPVPTEWPEGGADDDPHGEPHRGPHPAAEALAALQAALEQGAASVGGIPTGDGWLHLFADHAAAIGWAEQASSIGDRPLAIAVHRGRVLWWTHPTTGRTHCAGPAVSQLADQLARTAVGTISVDGDRATATVGAMVGRADELARVLAALDAAPIATLTGTGGIGKTRIAHQLVGRWPGAIAWCDLTHAAADADLVRVVAGAIGTTASADAVRNALAGRTGLLVVLDAFESVLDEAARVGGWAAGSPGVRFLVTSRAPLGVPGESVIPIGPLSDAEVHALLADRANARGVSPGGADRLADEVGGVPLAVELAVGRIGLDGGSPVPVSDRSVFPPGAPADDDGPIRAALDATWALLDDDARTLFAELSVFEGGFTAPAVEAVGSGRSRSTDVLMALIDRSLVAIRGDRLVLLDPVRAYAKARLDPEAARRVSIRHGGWCARLGRRLSERANAGVGELVAEYDNLVAAHRAAMARGEREVAIDTARGLTAVLRVRGPFDVAVTLLRDLLLAVPNDATGEPPRVSARPPTDELSVARALSDALRAAWRIDEGRALCAAWIPRARAAGDRRNLSSLLGDLAQLEGQAGAFEAARTHMEEAIAISRADGLAALAPQLNGYAMLHVWLGDDTAAEALFREAGTHDPDDPVILGNLGAVLADRGKFAESEDCCVVALEWAQQDGDLRMEAYVRATLGLVAGYRGDLRESLDLAHRARELHRRVGNTRSEAMMLDRASEALVGLGRPEEAVAHSERALEMLLGLGAQINAVHARLNLAVAIAELGRLPEALATFAETARLSGLLGDRFRQAWALAEAAIRSHPDPAARGLAEQALDLVPGFDQPDFARRDVARMVWWALGVTSADPLRAIEAFDRGIAVFGDCEPHRVAILICERAAVRHGLGHVDEARTALDTVRAAPRHAALDRAIARLERLVAGSARDPLTGSTDPAR